MQAQRMVGGGGGGKWELAAYWFVGYYPIMTRTWNFTETYIEITVRESHVCSFV